jgi:hypothetical protein
VSPTLATALQGILSLLRNRNEHLHPPSPAPSPVGREPALSEAEGNLAWTISH